MSVTGIKILATTRIGTDNAGEVVYMTDYRPTTPINGHDSGTVNTPLGEITESTFNLLVQQAVADRANAETSNVEEFDASDVFGGRL